MDVSAPRGEPFSVWEGSACAALAVALVVAEGATGVPGVLRGELPNPDSTMRLVRLKDMLAVGAPLDTVARDGSGHGVLVQWSHLLDSLTLLLAAPLVPWLGWDEALRWVALGFGPLCIGGLGAALAWAVAPIAARRWRLFAPLLAGIMLPVAAYGVPGVVHHHVLLALAAVMMAGWAGRAATGVTGAGQRVGAWGAAGLWLSPEAVPFTLMAFAAIAIAFFARPGDRRIAAEIRGAGAWYMLLVAATLAADPPLSKPCDPAIDRLSVLWLVLAVACGASGCIVQLTALRRWPRFAVLFGAVPVLVWLAALPAVIRGTDAPLTPSQARAFLDAIAEFQSVRSADALQFLSTGVLASLLAGLLAWRTRSLAWCWAASCSLAVLVLATQHLRFATYSAVLGAMALPVALTWCDEVMRQRRRGVLILARPALLLAFVVGPTAGAAASRMTMVGEASRIVCVRPPSVELLAPAAGQVVLASPGETPDLLYRTRVLTVGSLYHRGITSYMRARAAWRSFPSAVEPPSVRATEARWVLLCRGAARDRLVADLPPDTLQDDLERGEIPPWLQPAGTDAAGWMLWRVLDPSSP